MTWSMANVRQAGCGRECTAQASAGHGVVALVPLFLGEQESGFRVQGLGFRV